LAKALLSAEYIPDPIDKLKPLPSPVKNPFAGVKLCGPLAYQPQSPLQKKIAKFFAELADERAAEEAAHPRPRVSPRPGSSCYVARRPKWVE
jgi:hypothetical protein